MRAALTIFLTVLIQHFALGQSPFNYGQNEDLYFISTELRNKLDIKEIYEVDGNHERGGMDENWDVTLISFDTNSVTDNWYPLTLDDSFQYSFDSIKSVMEFLNGNFYQFSNGQLVSYGGDGYGTFDWNEIVRFSDTVSLVVTYCVGHCGPNTPIRYTRNIFNKRGQLVCKVSYPTPDEADENDEYIEEMYGNEIMQEKYEELLNSRITPENTPDTFWYKYDDHGLLLDTGEESIMDISVAKRFFEHLRSFPPIFHECYIGNVEMEKFIQQKLGYTPDIILLEIYRHAIFSFALNHYDKKYYRNGMVILE